VTHHESGYTNSLVPVNELNARDGMGNLRVNFGRGARGYTIQSAVDQTVQALMTMNALAEWPKISYDYDSQTAFLYFRNPSNSGASYMKMIISGDNVYTVTANYNEQLSPTETIDELREMVANFTLIGS
jgi:hypothetical protein